MKKIYFHKRMSILTFLLFFSSYLVTAQTTINTTVGSTGYADNNGVTGNSCVTFVVENNSGGDILLTQVANQFQTASNGTNVALWYSATSLSGAVTVATPDWTQITTGGPIAVPATGIYDLFTGLSFTIPNGVQYRFAIQSSSSIRYSGTGTGQSDPDIFTVGGVSLKVGEAQIGGEFVGWGGAFPTPPNSPRWLIGSITFQPASPCTDPPTPGTVNTNQNPVCAFSNFTLNLTGGTGGIGQTYQWQSSPDSTNWTDITGATTSVFTTNQSVTTYYRAKVTCGTTTANSAGLKISTPSLVSGNFTINNVLPTGGNNFATFTEAIDYIKCGINGPVVLRVEPGTGPYNEQITIPQIGGASATNTVTIKGNLTTLAFNSTNANARAGITLDGADHIKIDSLIIDGTAGTYGWGVHFTNQADSNRVRGCTINVSPSNTTSGNHYPIVFSGSFTSPTTAGNNGNYDTIANNILSGGYYNISLYGNSTAGAQNKGNVVRNNKITDSYAYSIYTLYQSGAVISGNDISRPSRSSSTTTGGVYASTGNIGLLIEKNRIHNMFDALTSTSTLYAIYTSSSAPTVAEPNRIINNLVYNVGGNGALYGIYNTGSPNMQAYHNTISIDGQIASTGAGYGIYQTGAVDGIDVRNNLVYVTRSGTGTKRALWFNTTTATVISNRNVLYMNTPSGTNNNLVQYGTTNYATLADWKASNGSVFDQQSISVDPLFMNPGAGDYTPQDPAINGLGANLGVTTDILGTSRSSSPDPGAFEFTVTGLDGALTWVAPIPPVTAGMKTITVNLANTQTVTITSANISYTDGTNVVTENFTGLNIAVGGSQQLSFATQYNLVTSVKMQAYINTVNGVLDNAATNDTTAIKNFCLPLSGNYTINNVLPTGGINFQSFTEAAEQLSCGGVTGPVVFTVAGGSGPYNEQVVISPVSGASATNTITFKGSMATLAFNSTNSGLRAGITLDGADHIKIDSLIIDGTAGTYGWGVFMTNQADSNRVSNCIINVSTTNTSSVAHAPIVISGSYTSATTSGNNGNYDTVMNCTLSGGYYNAVLYGSSTAGAQNIGNVIRKSVLTDAYSYAIYLVYQSGTWVSANNISRPTRSASTTTAGVYASTNCMDLLVSKNRVHNMFDGLTSTSTCYGFYSSSSAATASQPNRFYNNLVYNVGGNGALYGIYNSSSQYMKAYHNTISLDGQAASTGAAYGFYQTGTAANIDFRNNIVNVSRAGTGTKRCLYFVTTASDIVSNRNILYMNAPSGTNNHLGQYGSTNYTTLVDWKGANTNAYDQQSISLDPMFQNPGGGNYLPLSSLGDNLGTGLGVLTDILDSTRSTTNPDAGAYEFSTLTSGINMSAEGLVTPATQANGCYGPAETVTIRIRNSSTATIDFSVTPVTVTTNVSGAANVTLNASLTSGTLASDSTLNVPMTQTLDMSATGVYTFNANTTVAGDVNTVNDMMIPVNRTKVQLSAGAASGPSGFCVSQPINPTLSSMGYSGYTGLQWVQSTMPVGGYAAIGGGTTVPFTVSAAPTQTMYYKLVATCGAMKDSSSVVMVAYNDPQVTNTTPGSRCGTGTVSLGATASSGATLEWYAAPTGGSPLGTGTSFTTPSLSADSTYFYVAANISGGSGGASPLLITELDLGDNDQLEIQNVSPSPVDVTGWKVAISNSYTDITSVNANVQTLSGIINPGQTMSWTDAAAGPNYWGSNILWNPGAYPTYTGWAAILDNNNNLVDVVFLNWPSSNIQGASITVGTTTITVGTQWSGNGIDITTVAGTQSVSRQGTADNNSASDFSIINLSVGTTNSGMTLPFTGFGCSSARTAVLARTNDCPMPVTLLSFTGEKQGTINKLLWTTTTEVNNAGFELERSADGKNFSKIAFVASLADGNSNQALNYVYFDERPLAGNGYYRLKQVDKDGKFTYSNVVLIKGSKVKEIMITSLYPNPAESEINVIITSPVSERVTLVVTDMTGKVVNRTNVQLSAGDNLSKLQVSQLASGTYFIKTICANGCESQLQKFVKQ